MALRSTFSRTSCVRRPGPRPASDKSSGVGALLPDKPCRPAPGRGSWVIGVDKLSGVGVLLPVELLSRGSCPKPGWRQPLLAVRPPPCMRYGSQVHLFPEKLGRPARPEARGRPAG